MGSAPRNRQGIAAGLMATARNVGMVLGVGLSGAIFTTVLAHYPGETSLGLYESIQVSFLVVAGVAAIGILTSAVRGKPEHNQVAEL